MSKRFFLCGIMQESNSFNPTPATDADFAYTRREGEAVLRGEVGGAAQGMVDTLLSRGYDVTAGVVMKAKSGGPVAHEVVDEFLKRNLALLRGNTWDGVVVSLHGAMLTDVSEDACGDILTAIREAVGETAVVTASCDLHANVTERMLCAADHICGYQTYPHLDFYEVGCRAATLAARAVEGESLVTVRAAVPMMAPAHAYTTNTPALKAVMDRGHALVSGGDIADFSVFQVQPWLNVAKLASTVLVTAATEEQAAAVASELVNAAFALREVLQGEPLMTIEEVIQTARANTTGKPVVLVDSADSPNAGATGDTATVIEALLPYRDELYAAASVDDVPAVEKAFALGVGGKGDFTLGATVAPKLSTPVTVPDCTVVSLHSGEFRMQGPASRGEWRDMGKTAVLAAGKLRIVVNSHSCYQGDVQFYRGFGVEPMLQDLIAVKACTSLRAGYEPISAAICNAATPGAAGVVLKALPFDRLPKPFYPFEEITESDITPPRRHR
ncbi:MAG: M81 family metallopeptidase [Clostridia bacterium]|nr:M81 family metallopeptidase [Clostridia bacterium]